MNEYEGEQEEQEDSSCPCPCIHPCVSSREPPPHCSPHLKEHFRKGCEVPNDPHFQGQPRALSRGDGDDDHDGASGDDDQLE